MLIALSVTVVALLASREVRNAFFRMNQITTRIAQLEGAAARSGSEGQHRRVDRAGQRVDDAVLPRDQTGRRRSINGWHRSSASIAQSVDYLNQTWAQRGLKRYVVPPDIDKTLTDKFGSPAMTEATLNEQPC